MTDGRFKRQFWPVTDDRLDVACDGRPIRRAILVSPADPFDVTDHPESSLLLAYFPACFFSSQHSSIISQV